MQICDKCGSLGNPVKRTKGSLGLEIVLWLFFLVPGFIYSIWRLTTREEVCEKCQGQMIPLDTPRGSMLMNQFHQPSKQDASLPRTTNFHQTHSYSYFYSVDENNFGPYSLGQMLDYKNSGKISRETLVVREGDKEWRKLSEFIELSG